MCEPRDRCHGDHSGDFGKRGGGEQLVTATVTRAPGDTVTMSDVACLGRLWGPGKNELCNWSLNTWFSVPDPSIPSCVVSGKWLTFLTSISSSAK